jgi:hypothetical protein
VEAYKFDFFKELFYHVPSINLQGDPMKTNAIPKTIKKWLDKNAHIVHEFHMEEDEWGEEHEGPWSIWVYFKLGWRNELHYEHQIHEPTVKDFMDATLFIKPCDCADCTFSQES